MYPTISTDPFVQGFYEHMRDKGESHSIAEMLALQQAPAGKSDYTFVHGHCNGNQFEGNEAVGDYYAAMAAKAGVNVKGKVYKSGLARFAGDPQAWIEGASDVKRICDTNGWGCQGSVNVPLRKIAEPLKIGVSPAVVDDVLNEVTGGSTDHLQPREVADLRDKIESTLAPHWTKKNETPGPVYQVKPSQVPPAEVPVG